MAVQEVRREQRIRALFASEPEAMRDPYTLFGELRDHAPLHEFEGAQLVSRYDDVRLVTRDPRFGKGMARAERAQRARSRLAPEEQHAFDTIAEYEGLQVVGCDPPQHDRLRRIAHRAFTPARIAAFEPVIERYIDELLRPVGASDVGDLSEFAYALPLMVISDMLGIPKADGEMIHGWTKKIARNKGGAVIDREALMAAFDAVTALKAYVLDVYEETRRSGNRASDLVAALMDAEEEERLSIDEMAAMFGVLIFGGHETTTNLIGIGLLELLRHRDAWEALCADPDRAGQTTEELLRFVTPVQWLQRVAREDCEVAGGTIHKGDTVFAILASANRDPAVFEHPDELDIFREDAHRHLAFGFGTHFCLGAALARMEGTLAFRALARRFPQMELAAANGDVEWTGSALLRTLDRLPVRLGPDHAAAG